MKPNEINVDLEKRKKQVASVSAYSTLRNSIYLLCTFFIVGIVSWTLFAIILVSINFDRTASFGEGSSFLMMFSINLLLIISCAAIIIFIAIVVRDFSLAMIDSVDLQLLSNRRNALERKESLDQDH